MWVIIGDSQRLRHNQEPYLAPQPFTSNPHKALPRHLQTETGSDLGYHLSSEISSIGPSQSASQVNMNVDESTVIPPSVIPNAPNPILGVNGSDIQPGKPKTSMDTTTNITSAQVRGANEPTARPNSSPPPAIPSSDTYVPRATLPPRASQSLTNVVSTGKNTMEHTYEYTEIQVPPAHAISDLTMPTVAPTASRPETTRTTSGYLTPVSHEGEKSRSRSTLEGQTANGVTRPTEDLDAEDGADGPDLSKEERLVEEGRLVVVDNPRYQQGAIVSDAPVPQAPIAEGARETKGVATGMDETSQVERSEPNVTDVREIREEGELPEQPTSESVAPGVPPPCPTGEPQTPKKRTQRPVSRTPQKSGFLGSLKKVFGGHRDDSVEREERAREKEEKAREKEERKEEKAREREKREERLREREEKKEERQREREERERVKKKQKEKRGQERQMRVLMPDSSDEGETLSDNDSFGRRRAGKSNSGFLGLGKKNDKWTTRTDKNLSEIRRESAEADQVEGVVDGFIVKRNANLQRNLGGGIVAGHAAPLDLRKGRARGYSDASLRSAEGSAVGGRKLRKGERTASAGRSFVFERGGRVGRSSSVPPETVTSGSGLHPEDKTTTFAATTTTGLVFPPPPLPRPIATTSFGTETRFREELNSQSGSSAKISPSLKRDAEVVKDKGYTSDVTGFASSVRTFSVPTAPGSAPPVSGPIGAPAIERKPSKGKKRISVNQVDGGEGVNLGRQTSVLGNATAPAGMSTGLGGRRGSVGVSVATQSPAVGTSPHRRAISVDYGPGGKPAARSPPTRVPAPITSPGRSSMTQMVEKPQESLMSIVDNVTRSNRHAWDAGLMESRIDRTRSAMRSEVGSTFLGPVTPGTGVKSGGNVNTTAVGAGTIGSTRNGVGTGAGPSGMKGGGTQSEGRALEGMGDIVRAPPRVDRQALLSSLKETSRSPGRSQPATTAYMTIRTQVDGAHDKKPLKSALRVSRSPSPDPVSRGSMIINDSGMDRSRAHGYVTGTGKDRVVPMEMLPSMSSLPVEEQRVPAAGVPPIGRAERVADGDGNVNRRSDEDDSSSTSSYETGHESPESDNEDEEEGAVPPAVTSTPLAAPRRDDRRPDLGTPQSAVPPPVRTDPNAVDVGISPRVVTPNSTPQRRKSVRVSLKPTFSPTPPAIEDEEDEAGRAPFVFKDDIQVVTSASALKTELLAQAPPPVAQVPKGYGTQKNVVKDIWDDNSDDDMEYQRAKRLLMRATRREQEVLR